MQVSTVGGEAHCRTVAFQCLREFPQFSVCPSEIFVCSNEGRDKTNCLLEVWNRFIITFEVGQRCGYAVEAHFIVGLEFAQLSIGLEGITVHELSRVCESQVPPCGNVHVVKAQSSFVSFNLVFWLAEF